MNNNNIYNNPEYLPTKFEYNMVGNDKFKKLAVYKLAVCKSVGWTFLKSIWWMVTHSA